MTRTELESVEELSKALSRIDGVEIDCQTNEPCNEKLCVFFTYKKDTATIEQQVRFIDWFAKMLGSSEDYAAYSALVEMIWMGDKGVDGMNKPLFAIETTTSEIDSLREVINTSINLMGDYDNS